MKKRVLAMLFAVLMMTGCGGAAEEYEGNTTDQQAEELLDDAEEIDAEIEMLVETMKDELSVYPELLTPDEAAAEGMYTIANGAVSGQEEWDAFMAGEQEYVILCQFTEKGGAMLNYVMRQENGSYLVVSDLTRDGNEHEEKEDYSAQSFTEIKVFENFMVQEGGTPHTVCVMTNDAKLDAATFLQYWNELSYEENGAFLLFMI